MTSLLIDSAEQVAIRRKRNGRVDAASSHQASAVCDAATVRLAQWLRAISADRIDLDLVDRDWTQFAINAAGAGVSGLILERASALKIELPDAVTHHLKADTSATVSRNLHLEHELIRLLQAFNCERVPVMLLKGAALQRTIYDHPGLRPMLDIDLLIRPRDMDRATQILVDNSCRRGAALMRDDFFPRFHYESEWFVDSPCPAKIDLHARALRPVYLSQLMSDDALWHEAAAVRIGTATAYIPRTESMLIHLAAHAAFHGCSRLLWLYDMKLLINRHKSEMNWSLIFERCREWHLSLAVLTAIEQAEELLDPFCPVHVLRELRSHSVTWRDRMVLRQAPRDAARPLTHLLVNFLTTRGLPFRFAYAKALLAPSRTHLAESYPYRHRGWVACANLLRSLRAVSRLICAPFRRVNPA